MLAGFLLGCCVGGRVAILLEGLEVSTADDTLQALRETCPPTRVLLAVPKRDLMDDAYAQKVRLAVADGHTVAIRFDPNCTICRIKDIGRDRVCRCLKRTAAYFEGTLGVAPRHVLFPHTANPVTLALLADCAQCADGMQAVTYAFDLEAAMYDPYRKCDPDKRETLRQGLVLIYGFVRERSVPFAEKLKVLQEMARFAGLALSSFGGSTLGGPWMGLHVRGRTAGPRGAERWARVPGLPLSDLERLYFEGEQSSEDARAVP